MRRAARRCGRSDGAPREERAEVGDARLLARLGASASADALRSCAELVWHSKGLTPADAPPMARALTAAGALRKLRVLQLHHNELRDEGLTALAPCLTKAPLPS